MFSGLSEPSRGCRLRANSAKRPAANTLNADNQLLELLEKDLNKAVEQPKERRRLQFSKQVVDHPKVRQFIR